MKQQRTIIVLFVAAVTAGIATYGVYQGIQRMPVRQVEAPTTRVVVAAEYIPVGTRLTSDHLRVVSWPARNPVQDAFSDPQQVIDRV